MPAINTARSRRGVAVDRLVNLLAERVAPARLS